MKSIGAGAPITGPLSIPTFGCSFCNCLIISAVLHDNGFVITLEEGGSVFDLNNPNITAGTILLRNITIFLVEQHYIPFQNRIYL